MSNEGKFVTMDSIPQKTCSKCHKLLPQQAFSRDKSKSDGYYSSCKECVSKRQKQERKDYPERVHTRETIQHSLHKEQMNANRRQKYAESPELYRERSVLARQRHIVSIRAKDRERYATNREYKRQTHREYYQNHKDIFRACSVRYLARKKHLPNNFTVADWERSLNYFNGCCAVCGRQLNDLFGTHKPAADHWIPLTDPNCPGSVPENIVPLCHGMDGCNTSKHNTLPKDWLERKFGKRKAKEIENKINIYFEWVAQCR